MKRFLDRLFVSNSGVTTVEYALVAALIAAATVNGIALVSPSLFAVFKTVSESAPVD